MESAGSVGHRGTDFLFGCLSVVELPYPVQPQRSPKARVTFTPPPCFFAPFHIQVDVICSWSQFHLASFSKDSGDTASLMALQS
mmetsp:Transcript_17736/g.40141  ORF Transcript_17736/g.40141 Transcript_17736/m.40141 type:complete len:84 (+) Transcript_17736:2343-2594(+)